MKRVATSPYFGSEKRCKPTSAPAVRRYAGQKSARFEDSMSEIDKDIMNSKEQALQVIERTLSPSQRAVYDKVLSGESLFFTGEAGTGKSFLLDAIVKRARLQKRCVYVTASTGIAACAIGGTTLHSFAGVGLGEEPGPELVKKLMDGRTPNLRKAAKRWRETEILVIDECSMLDPAFFEKLDYIARQLRPHANEAPFGGIQVLLTGDFFQLPPVVKQRRPVASICVQDQSEDVDADAPQGVSFKPKQANSVQAHTQSLLAPLPIMIFETKAWKEAVGGSIHLLKEAHRQRDERFLALLRNLRNGELTREDMQLILERMRASGDVPEDAVRLYPTRKEVENVNNCKLATIAGDEHVFEASDKGQAYILESYKDHWMAPQRLVLKEGALVMFIKNLSIEEGIINGTVGKVVGFGGMHGAPKVQLPNGNVVQTASAVWEIKQGDVTIACREQIPLMLAWACTIHKSQGMSLTKVEVSMTRIFEKAQLYVALSRCTTIGGLYLVGNIPRPDLLKPNAAVAAWWNDISQIL